MMPAKRFRPVVLAAAAWFAALSGCASSTHRVTLDMPPRNVAAVSVTGSGAFVTVTNDGPGVVTMTDLWGSPRELIRGARGRTVRPDEELRIESLDDPAVVHVETLHATGLNVEGPIPK